MEFLNFLREEPVMGWFIFLALLVTVVPAASVLWRRIFRRNQAEVKKQTAPETKSTHFGNRTEFVVLFLGLLLLLVVIGWIRSAFFG
ncbi:MAG: hypothetical protein NUV51_08730 [Sulfuricaulis sp.]|nr:hypothetical protein [Sulfuricaulis sp.]